MPKVCIIGAGSAGLITLYELRSRGISCIVLERLSHVAGIWKATQSNAMYDSLVTNLPKEIMGYSPKFRFCSSLPSFVKHTDMQQYLEEFARANSLLDNIRLSCNVSNIKKSRSSSRWTVEYEDAEKKSIESLECDAVVVCNGHFNAPLWPDIPGLAEFSGEVVHSASYKNPSPFRDKVVLVIGTKSSATDISRELVGVAAEVHVCNRSHTGPAVATTHRYIERQSLSGQHGHVIWTHPAIDHIDNSIIGESMVCFVNGDRVRADCLLLATGYRYDFPFLSPRTDGAASDDITPAVDVSDKAIRPLYQHIFHCDDPTLSFVGLPHTIVPFPVFWLQARWVANVYWYCLGGEHVHEEVQWANPFLPSKADRRLWLEQFELCKQRNIEGGGFPRNYHHMGSSMWSYMHSIRRLLATTDEEDSVSRGALVTTTTGVSEERWLGLLESIYNDTGSRRPKDTGGSDAYRLCQYTINW